MFRMAIILASGSCLKGCTLHHHHPNHYHHHDHHRPHHGHTCGDEMNINLRAAVIHVLGDLLQSIGVFVAACVVTFFVSTSNKFCLVEFYKYLMSEYPIILMTFFIYVVHNLCIKEKLN